MFHQTSSYVENAVNRTERRVRRALDCLRGNLSILRRAPLDAEQRSALQGVDQSTSEVLRVIEQLRDLTTSTADQPAQSFRFDLERTLGWLGRQFRGAMKSEGIEFKLIAAPGIPSSVLGDARRLRSVLVCLLDNALQFTNSGTVTLKATPGSREPVRSVPIRFEVFDDGPGLSPELVKAIRTETLCQQTAPSLSMVQSWLESMNSRLEFTESVQGGTHLSFELAFLPDQEPDQSHPRSSLIGRRILIVDHSLAGRRLLEKSLSYVGASSVSYSDLSGAIRFLKSGELPDTIILDSELPDTTAEEAARAVLSYSDAPLILVVPLAVRGDGPRYREMGCRAYLVKPLHQEQILEALSAALATAGCQPFITTHSLEEATKLNTSVLLLADEEMLSRQAEHLLRGAGHTVTRLKATREAIQALHDDSNFDIILLEGNACTPGFLAALAQWRPTVPRIGLVTPDEAVSARLGLDDLLYIPLRSWELSQIVSRWAGRELQRAKQVPVTDEAPPIRLSELIEATDGDEELQREMINAFCEDLEESFRKIDRSMEVGDLTGVSVEGHALKGSAPYFGADKFASLADELQRVSKSGDRTGTQPVLEACRTEYKRILRFFEIKRGS